MGDDDISVKVGVRIRPQIPREIIDMCRICTTVTPGEPQVTLGSDKSFTYNYVFDMGESQEAVYETCVSRLIEGALEGYNATVLAYGQTGSGKTYTMGTGFDVEVSHEQIGIIPRAIRHLFNGIEYRIQDSQEKNEIPPEFKIVAQFMELYNEEVIDLFDPIKDSYAKKAIKIHEDPQGGIHVSGIVTKPILSAEDALECLRVGALSRTTASTQMNSQSSRSHAIFTLHIKQQRMVKIENPDSEEPTNEFETLTAKFHFVDLAGSERLKRTGATGERAKEGISINCGLLALGNVISALGDKSKRALHVPYRDSRLTRLLQDSLGGNSQTVMIACISPSDRDFMETLNTLKYANRARNIKNRVVINQDRSSRTITLLRQEIAQLQLELLEYKQGKRVIGADGNESINDMFHENTMLQSELNNLRTRVKAMQETIDTLSREKIELLTEKTTGLWCTSGGDVDVTEMVQAYLKEIEELRVKLLESDYMCQDLRKQLNKMQSNRMVHSSMSSDFISNSSVIEEAKKELQKEIDILSQSMRHETPDDDLEADNEKDNSSDEKDHNDGSGSDTDTDEKDNLGTELAELSADINMKQKLIEELELSQKRLQLMKQHYEDKLLQLQVKIKDTENERDKVLTSFSATHTSEPIEKIRKVRDQYEHKLSEMQKELKRLQAAKKEHARLLRNQTQHENQLRALKNDLGDMKRTKVKLINQMKEETVRHKEAETRRLQEIAQLRKKSLKNANMIRSLESERKLKEQVLKRKQEEVNALRRFNRSQLSHRAAGHLKPPQPFSPKEANKKWHTIEKNINKVVLKKQVVACQERDMNRLLQRRETLSRDLERLRQQKEAVSVTGNSEMNEIDAEIESAKSELAYVQDSITEVQNNIMEVEDTKENSEIADIQSLASSIYNVEEARYLIEKLFNMALTQSYNAAQRDLKVQEKETELDQMKQDHNIVNQLLEYMMQQSKAQQISINTSVSSNNTNESDTSSNSSRSTSPVPSSVSNKSKDKDAGTKTKVRKRMAVPRELLFGTPKENNETFVMTQSQDPDALRHLLQNPIVRVPSAPGSLKGLLPLRTNTQIDLRKPSPVMSFKLTSENKDGRISPRSSGKYSSVFQPMTAKHGSVEQGLDAAPSPPGSPLMLRRTNSIREDNVFSRLAAPLTETHRQKGFISPYTGRMQARSPLQCMQVAEGHSSGVLCVSATDQLLLSGSVDRTARLWDLTTGVELATLHGHPNNVIAVSCNRTGSTALTASASFVKLWDLRASSHHCVAVLCSSGSSQPGSYLAFVSSRNAQLPIGESQINDVVFNHSGQYVYTASAEKVKLWDLRKLSIIGKLSGAHQAAVMCLAVKQLPNGDDMVITGSKDHYVKVFKMNPNQGGTVTPSVNLEPPHYDGIQSLALGDGVLFSGSRDMCIKKWDLEREELVQSTNNAHKGWVCGLVLVRGGALLASGCRAGHLRLWDSSTCDPLADIKAHNAAINAISANSTQIFTASNDSKIKVWKMNERVLGT